MSSTVLANMAIKLNAETQAFTSGINSAQKKLTQFQGTANQLKGVNLNSLKVSFDRQVSSLSALQKQAREYGKALRHATDEKEIKALNAALEQTQVEMSRIRNLGRQGLTGIGTGANFATKGMKNLSGSAGQVNMEFARIIQDAPYGMMGIGNNIQQLTANFGQLRTQAGSTKVALSAALSSMMTPAAALTLGIAGLTTAWTLYEKWSQKSAKATKEGADAMENAEQSADDYLKTLDELTRSKVQGQLDAQKELTTLKLLYKQTQNTALSLRDRTRAVDELQRIYPTYFGNLKDEDILAGKAATTYNKLTTSILATAKARAAQDLIAENARKQLLNEQKIVDLKEKQLKAEAEAQRRAAQGAKYTGGGSASAGAIAGQIARDAQKQEEKINEIIGERQKLELENVELQQRSLTLEKQITVEVGKGGSLTEDNNRKLERTLQLKEQIARVSTGTTAPLETRQGAEVQNSKAVEDPSAVAAGYELIPMAIARASESQSMFFQNLYAEAERAKEQAFFIADAVGNVASSAFSALGEGIGNMFIGMETGIGVLKNVGKALLSAVNDFAKSFGQRLLAIGLGELLLGLPTGGLKVAAGAGLIALSSLSSAMSSGSGSKSAPAPKMTSSAYQAPFLQRGWQQYQQRSYYHLFTGRRPRPGGRARSGELPERTHDGPGVIT
jgi:hypothetical protein